MMIPWLSEFNGILRIRFYDTEVSSNSSEVQNSEVRKASRIQKILK